MILINDSFGQTLLLYFLSFALPKQKFYIFFKDNPNKILAIIIKILNLFCTSNFKYKSIKFFRNKYPNISDQRSINSIFNFYSDKFEGEERNGGQIYIENELRIFTWQNSVIDEILNYYFYKKNEGDKYIDSSQEKIFKLLTEFRKIERLLELRLKTLKSSLHYFILLFMELVKAKFTLKKKAISTKEYRKIIKPIAIHDFNTKKENQGQDLVIKAINTLSKDYRFSDVLQEKDFIAHLIRSNQNAFNFKSLIKMIIIISNLFKELFLSKSFLQKSSKLIDSFTELFIKDIIVSSDFKVLIIDPVQGPSLPFLSYFIKKGHYVYFTSFSIGNCPTKACSDYNGTFSKILSPHVGLTNLAKKSGFNGEIIQTECYLTNANKILLKKDKKIYKGNKKLEIIIPESCQEWFFSLSKKESFEFIEMIYKLKFQVKANIFLKKKKSYSDIEDYLNNNLPSHKIKFLAPIRGLMIDFIDKDFIISSGISSLGIKASELFNIPYIIYDQSNNSFNEWNNVYFNAKLKPKFAKNLHEVKNIINKSKNGKDI